ncbi:putative 5-3 exonuclease, partial [Phycomyces nitens]
DNLYLDITQTIHDCFDLIEQTNITQKNFQDILMEDVFSTIEQAVDYTHPRKLLFVVIDGVPPATKLNQQKYSRSSHTQFLDKRLDVDNGVYYNKTIITPGTSFMEKLGDYIRFRLSEKLTSKDHWEGLRILFSDAYIPGTGEWKIVSYIRSLQESPTNPQRRRHVLWGADRKLILMGMLYRD